MTEGPIKEAHAYGIDSYLKQAKRLPTRTFFFASDEEALMAELKNNSVIPFERIHVLWDGGSPPTDSLDQQLRVGAGAVLVEKLLKGVVEVNETVDGVAPTFVNGTHEAIEAMVDITLLSRCDYFVGSLSSFFTRSSIRAFLGTSWHKVSSRSPLGRQLVLSGTRSVGKLPLPLQLCLLVY